MYTEKVKTERPYTRLGERARRKANRIGEELHSKINIMYQTKASLVGENIAPQAWTRQHGLYTDWDHLFRELITVLIYEKKMHLGMLNPFAEVYIPKKDQNNGKGPHKAENESNKTQKIQEECERQDHRSQNNESSIKSDWHKQNFGWQIADKKVKHKRVVKACKPTTPISNRYEVLADEKEYIGNENVVAHVIAKDIEKEDLEKVCGRLKIDAEELKECFEVEKMTVSTLEEFIKKMLMQNTALEREKSKLRNKVKLKTARIDEVEGANKKLDNKVTQTEECIEVERLTNQIIEQQMFTFRVEELNHKKCEPKQRGDSDEVQESNGNCLQMLHEQLENEEDSADEANVETNEIDKQREMIEALKAHHKAKEIEWAKTLATQRRETKASKKVIEKLQAKCEQLTKTQKVKHNTNESPQRRNLGSNYTKKQGRVKYSPNNKRIGKTSLQKQLDAQIASMTTRCLCHGICTC